MDYDFYEINGYTCFIISGAYSVDKYWRLQRAGLTEENNNPKQSGWFANEQLTTVEMTECMWWATCFNANGGKADFVFTHTCPYSWRPTDLFLNGIDQSKVDNTMELWMDQLKDMFQWNIWCFGHYHADRLERPHVEQYYNDIDTLENIWNRWQNYDKTKKLEWWLAKSPNFYIDS